MRTFVAVLLALAIPAQAAQVREYRYTHGELQALVVHKQTPEYPFEARRTHQQGEGYVRIYVARDGNITGVIMLKSTGHELLDASCLKAFRNWRLKSGARREIDAPVSFMLSPGPYRPSTPAERRPTIVREFRD
jgi:TonB family protein